MGTPFATWVVFLVSNEAVPNGELIEAFWQYYRLFNSGDRADRLASHDLAWASDEVSERVDSSDPTIVPFLGELARAAPDSQAIAYLGAGPLEELLATHGPRWVEEIDDLAGRDPAFRRALSAVSFTGIDGDIAACLSRLSRPPAGNDFPT